MTTPCLLIFTARGTATLLADGGSQAWRLNPANASKVEYCVCVQNAKPTWGGADHPHATGFLVGRISEVVGSPERPERYLVRFSEYAEINEPGLWAGQRNPVRYSSLEALGIGSPRDLDWHPMPPAKPRLGASIFDEEGTELGDGDHPTPLTIAQARAGLAVGLGVPESAIEIIIRS